jgi:hypothetical protein
MSFIQDLEAWWAKLRTDSKPEFEQVKASLEAEVNLLKADVTGAWSTVRNDLQAEVEQYSPEVKNLVTGFITRIEQAVLAAVEKH